MMVVKDKKKILAISIMVISIVLSCFIIYMAVDKANEIRYGPMKTVLYHDFDGNVIKKVKVRSGFAEPPSETLEVKDCIFMGWDSDVINIVEDTNVYPIKEDISDVCNVVYANAVYGSSENELNVTYNIGGNVECSKMKLTIEYDPDVLQYVSNTTNHNFIQVKHNADEALIELVMDNKKNIASELQLLCLKFNPKAESYVYTTLNTTVEEILKIDSGGESVNTDCSFYDGKVYIY